MKSKIRVSSVFLDADLYNEAMRLKKRYLELTGFKKLSDSAWFAMIIEDGLPITRKKVERFREGD